MREEPAGLGPRDEACATEPEFAAAFADRAMRWIEPRPPRLPLPTVLPTRCFRCPWTLPDGVGCRWTGPGQPTGLAVAARRRYQVPDERESRNTAGPRWTPVAPTGPNLRNPCGGELAVHEKTGERTPEVPLAWRSLGTSQEYLAPTTEPSGTLNNARGNPTPSRRIPPPLLPPPGLSGTMGLPSPDAADTDAGRRRPAGPARAATAQSTAALAPAPAQAPAPRSRSPRPA